MQCLFEYICGPLQTSSLIKPAQGVRKGHAPCTRAASRSLTQDLTRCSIALEQLRELTGLSQVFHAPDLSADRLRPRET